MQNPISTNISPISERLLTLIAEGTVQFEKSKEIAQCQKCPIALTRKRVVVAQTLNPKRFFILAEFPEKEDESSEIVFSPNSSVGVILNLIDKLGITDSCYHAFALKCIPQKHTPEDHIPICAFENLRQEIIHVSPQTIFCFGMRGFWALSQLPNCTMETSSEFRIENQNIEIFLLPTAQELKQFPHWRLPVWEKLAHFKQKKNIDS